MRIVICVSFYEATFFAVFLCRLKFIIFLHRLANVFAVHELHDIVVGWLVGVVSLSSECVYPMCINIKTLLVCATHLNYTSVCIYDLYTYIYI